MTVTIGWWAIPLLATLVLFGWATWRRSDEDRHGDYDFAFWVPAAARLAAAIVGSLVAWLIWSLAR